MDVKKTANDDPIEIIFPRELTYSDQQLAVWYEEMLTGHDIREPDLNEAFRVGQCDDVMRRVIQGVLPPGMLQKLIADLIGIDPAGVTGLKGGRITLAVLIQLLLMSGKQFEDLGPFPPSEITVLAGLRKVIPLSAYLFKFGRRRRGLSQHECVMEISLADTGLLFCLLQADDLQECWVRCLRSCRHDARLALENPVFHGLLQRIFAETNSLLSFDAAACVELEQLRPHADELEPLLRRMATLWNLYRNPWGLAFEAVSTLFYDRLQTTTV